MLYALQGSWLPSGLKQTIGTVKTIKKTTNGTSKIISRI